MPNSDDNAVPQTGLYGWLLLAHEGEFIVKEIISKWKQLLGDIGTSENVYHSFIAEYAGFFWQEEQLVCSKVRLGSDYVTDFVVATDGASYGFEYELIELESPHTPAFTQSGQPSARLSAAIAQILKWKKWIDANRDQAKRLFPSKLFNLYDSPNFKFSIYIGRSENADELLALRNMYAKQADINIHGFDNLTRRLETRDFPMSVMLDGSAGTIMDAVMRNCLANPFFCAYSWEDWKKIVTHPEFRNYHMLANNCRILLEFRHCNSDFQRFLSFWETLPQGRKDFLFESLRARRAII